MMNRKQQKGVIVPFLAVALPVLIASLGLVIDNGAMYELKRRLQTAADAGSLAGAHEIDRSNYSEVVAAATYDAKNNGFEDDSETDSLVTVNRPPLAGRYKGNDEYVEVIVEERAPLFFMAAFREDGYLVRARSVAGARPDNHCIYALNPTDRDSFRVGGNAEVEFKNCGVQINSTDSTGARTNGGGTVKAKRFDVAGDYSGNGFDPEPHTGQPPLADPLADVVAPDVGSCDYEDTQILSDRTLDPGVYCDGLDIGSGAVVTLNSGTYIINGGGLTVGSDAMVTGTDVTFYITATAGHTYGAITVNGGAHFTVTAPTSGTLSGMLIFEDRELEETGDHKFIGGADMVMDGAVYTKNATVKMGGGFSAVALKVMLVADKFDISGNVIFAGLDTDVLPVDLLHPTIVE